MKTKKKWDILNFKFYLLIYFLQVNLFLCVFWYFNGHNLNLQRFILSFSCESEP